MSNPEMEPQNRNATPELHICSDCKSDLVYPIEWEEAGIDEKGEDQWCVTLHCPDCDPYKENMKTGIYDQKTVDWFDIELDKGTEVLAKALAKLKNENHEHEIRQREQEIGQFVGALEANLILPEDF